jgi:hypothetical protein
VWTTEAPNRLASCGTCTRLISRGRTCGPSRRIRTAGLAIVVRDTLGGVNWHQWPVMARDAYEAAGIISASPSLVGGRLRYTRAPARCCAAVGRPRGGLF